MYATTQLPGDGRVLHPDLELKSHAHISHPHPPTAHPKPSSRGSAEDVVALALVLGADARGVIEARGVHLLAAAARRRRLLHHLLPLRRAVVRLVVLGVGGVR